MKYFIYLLLAISAFGQTTPNLHLNIPPQGTANYDVLLNRNFSILDGVFGGSTSVPMTLTNPGLFTNTQMNLYMQSLVNSCSPATEFHANFGGSSNATEGVTGCINIPVSSTVFQSNAVAGYVNNSSGATTAGVALFGNARVTTTAGGRIWGGNFVATGLAGFASNSLYSTENDCNVANTTDVCHGMLVAGNFTAQPVTTDGITISAPGQSGACTVCTWPYGIRFAAGATTTLDLNHAAIVFYPISTASPSQSSQGMTFISYDSGGNNTAAFFNEDSSGNLVATTTKANSGILLNGSQITRNTATGTATVDLASVASGACTADSSDVTLTGAAVGDPARVVAATALPAGVWLIGRVTATNTGRFQLCNLSGGAVDRASDTYTISVVK